MIENAPLLRFTNESIRTTADLLAGLLTVPTAVLDAVVGQGLAATLGTNNAALLREAPWEASDYTALGAAQGIAGSDDSARVVLTNHDVIALLRVLVVVRQMIQANDQLGPLVRKIAVNPRSYPVA
ncbi:hypothetical protein VT84_03390 [Gemmata sp. SH-PL17]|uniref:hypothetical protein n=1 Tax=Gemmata sp. SH-PL17 TaxID=1630693 RepID=UPI00078EEA67|nr:hypothetical protein [Gemmata sp. SH-PL17]AMV23427.1 hypothetical protein VT84_03390 [Gemmata sp. SH-PL17]